ncbi:MAG: NUDIX domain-containing protein [Firmicutes bacterium]|nr:NUDIX domain-containing protein [Bacillota bacterium]
MVAVKGILLKNGRALILKRADDDEIGGGTWEFSGGKLEFGESPQEALKREFKEETGIDVEIKKLLYVTSFKTNPNMQVVLITYLCDCANCDVKLSLEHSDWMWANREEVKNRISQGIADDIGVNDLWEIFSED